MKKSLKAINQNDYYNDYLDNIKGFSLYEALEYLRDELKCVKKEYHNGYAFSQAFTLYSKTEWNKDRVNFIKAIEKLIKIKENIISQYAKEETK